MIPKKYLLKLFPLILLLVLTTLLAACGNKTTQSADILTQKIADPAKIPVTVLVKYAFTIDTFERAAEKEFPNLDLIQVGNYTSNMGIAEYEARLKHDDLTDMVMTWPLNVGEEYWEDRLIDLSSLPASGNYHTAMLNNISRQGRLYYLPGPAQIRGIVYNKTLFQENGWTVPTDFAGFLNLCQTIEDSGIRALQLGLGDPEVLDTAFVGYGLANSFSKPEDAKWIADYNQGQGSFGDHFASTLSTFQTLIDYGVLQKEDLNIHYTDREQMLFSRKCAMVEDSVLMARMGDSFANTTDEFGLMPFFNPGTDSDWARLYPICYIGANKHLLEPAQQEKYDLVRSLLKYISTKEGQLALVGDTDGMFSTLNGMTPPNAAELDDLLPALNHGRYAVFPTLKNAQNALRKGLAGMVAGTKTAADVVKMVDQENASPTPPTPPTVLGQATADFSLLETGNFITDVMRAQSGCEIALYLDNGKDGKSNGKGVGSRLYQGDITPIDIQRITADLKSGYHGELRKITMTGENLKNTLEYAIPVENNRKGWFYYFSGLRLDYAPAAQPGQRLRAITDDQGNAIVPEQLYTIAIVDDSVPAQWIASCDSTGLLLTDLLTQAIQEATEISPDGDGRFTVCQP